jgi:hypothetical protein
MKQTVFHVYDRAHHKGTITVTVHPGARREKVMLTIAMIDREWENEMAILLRPVMRTEPTLERVKEALRSTRYHIIEHEGEGAPA